MKPRRVRVRLAIAGLSLCFASGYSTHGSAATQASPSSKGPSLVYHKARSFRVPFHFDPAERSRRRELQLWVSEDLGRHWEQKGITIPDRPAFTFNSDHDGEYWLAIRSVDSQGRPFPADDVRIEPIMKVVVDTTPPSVVLEPQVRSVSLAEVRWELHDENPDPTRPPTLEYQPVEGSQTWTPVPIESGGLIGSTTWDTGFTQPVRVRATAVDRAGNKSETVITFGAGQEGERPVATIETKPGTRVKPEPAIARPDPEAAKPATTVAGSSQPLAAPVTSNETALARPGSVPAAQAPPVERPSDSGAANGPTESIRMGLPLASPQGAEPQRAPVDQVATGPGGGLLGQQPATNSVYPSAQDARYRDAALLAPPVALDQPSAQVVPAKLMDPVAPLETRSAAAMATAATSLVEAVEPSRTQNLPAPELEVPRVEGGDRLLSQARAAVANVDSLLPREAGSVGVASPEAAPPHQAAASPDAANLQSSAPISTLKVPGQRFLLDYAVDRAGPDGRPAAVELWVTRDGGKTWKHGGADPDRVSPILVNLESDGMHGISLIARDADGLGDKPPAPGDLPKLWIEVESSPDRVSRAPSLLQRAFRR